MQIKKIKVYGKLRQFLGKSYFEAAVKSPQQAMSFLMANFLYQLKIKFNLNKFLK